MVCFKMWSYDKMTSMFEGIKAPQGDRNRVTMHGIQMKC